MFSFKTNLPETLNTVSSKLPGTLHSFPCISCVVTNRTDHMLIYALVNVCQTASLRLHGTHCHHLLKHFSCKSNVIVCFTRPTKQKKICKYTQSTWKSGDFLDLKRINFCHKFYVHKLIKKGHNNGEGQGQHLGELHIDYKIIVAQ